MKVIDWHGLYSDSWGKSIVPEAYAHPAKYARGLIRAIYQHALEQKYLAPGDTVIDPFGGVALGAMDALRYGLHWTGVELEPKFVALGSANIDLWNAQFAHHFPGWGTARLLQGDSRQLCQVVRDAAAVVSSPPYINSVNANDSANDSQARRGRKVKSGIPTTAYHVGGPNSQQNQPQVYGDMDGQLGAMPEGQFAAAISSPPYANMTDKWNEGPGARFDPARHPNNHNKQSNDNGYGSTEGNLGNMGEGDGFAAAISSPPFSQSIAGDARERGGILGQRKGDINLTNGGNLGRSLLAEYGNSPGQLGAMTEVSAKHQELGANHETFWSAAALIVTQVHQVLKPGGVTIWVTGDFVRDRKRVMFGERWATLCESFGFITLEHIRTWKSEYHGIQLGLFGEDKENRKDRVSFFRRLANEKNPDSAILNEDVLIMQKHQ